MEAKDSLGDAGGSENVPEAVGAHRSLLPKEGSSFKRKAGSALQGGFRARASIKIGPGSDATPTVSVKTYTAGGAVAVQSSGTRTYHRRGRARLWSSVDEATASHTTASAGRMEEPVFEAPDFDLGGVDLDPGQAEPGSSTFNAADATAGPTAAAGRAPAPPPFPPVDPGSAFTAARHVLSAGVRASQSCSFTAPPGVTESDDGPLGAALRSLRSRIQPVGSAISSSSARRGRFLPWSKRQERKEGALIGMRPHLARALLRKAAVPEVGTQCFRSACSNLAAILCETCGFGFPMCAECDEDQHTMAHYHSRKMWLNGFYEPLPSSLTVVDGKSVDGNLKAFLLHGPSSYQKCGLAQWANPQRTEEVLTVIHQSGRHDFCKASFECLTPGCGHVQIQGPLDTVQFGACCATADDRRVSTAFDMDLLDLWHGLKMSAPKVSAAAFVATLEARSAAGGRVSPQHHNRVGPRLSAWSV